jgi:hypothetical protein
MKRFLIRYCFPIAFVVAALIVLAVSPLFV